MRYILLILNSDTGKWYVATQSEEPSGLEDVCKMAIDKNPMLVYRLIDVDAI